MKAICLEKFVSIVLNGKNIINEVVIDDDIENKVLMERLCDISIGVNRLNEAWSWLLHDINEKYYPSDMTNLFNDKILTFLINNQIALNSLGHLQLDNKWLNEIYMKDNKCIEALMTVEKRNKKA